MAFGAIGVTLALMGLGVPYLLAASLAAIAAGLVQFTALRFQPAPDRSAETALLQQLEDYRTQSATMRHDLRGILSPALMVSDRLLNHPEPGVQRAGTAVVKSIERATSLLNETKAFLTPSRKGPGVDDAEPSLRDTNTAPPPG